MTPDTRLDAQVSGFHRALACSRSTVLALDDPDRRAVVDLLLRRGTARLDRIRSEVYGLTPNESEREESAVVTSLSHRHLPKLESAGLVSVEVFDRRVEGVGRRSEGLGRRSESPGVGNGGRVRIGPHPDVRTGRLTSETLAAVAPEAWTRVGTLGRDPIRVELLSALARTPSGTATVGGLAADVRDTACEKGCGSAATGSESVDAVAAALHHVHLPKLASAGFVDHDPATHEVAYAGDGWLSLDALVGALSDARALR